MKSYWGYKKINGGPTILYHPIENRNTSCVLLVFLTASQVTNGKQQTKAIALAQIKYMQ